ncbi:MAG TPA: ATP-binding protein [Stellaceae bacterium]|jgi:anti-sigma regulatory factor (Ser/Thr protein kinase)
MAVHHMAVSPEIAEIPRLNQWVEEVLTAEGLDPRPILNATLAIEEAVVNVINHAFDGVPPPHQVALSLAVAAGRLRVELSDNGRAFDPASAAPPDLASPLEEREVGGLGLHLIRTMMDTVEYRREAGENRLVLEKSLS